MLMESRSLIAAMLEPQKPRMARVIYRGVTVSSHLDGHEWTRVVKCGILSTAWVLRSCLPPDAVEDEVYEIPVSELERPHL